MGGAWDHGGGVCGDVGRRGAVEVIIHSWDTEAQDLEVGDTEKKLDS